MAVKSVPIQLDRKRHLRFDFNAFVTLEEHFGITLANLGQILNEQTKLSTYRDLIWVGLQHEDESLTPKQVGDLLDLSRLLDYAKAVGEAFAAALPRAETEPPGDEKNAPRPEAKKEG